MVCILMTLHVVISVACIDLGFQVKYHFFIIYWMKMLDCLLFIILWTYQMNYHVFQIPE